VNGKGRRQVSWLVMNCISLTVAAQRWTYTSFHLYTLASGHRVTASNYVDKVPLKYTTRVRLCQRIKKNIYHPNNKPKNLGHLSFIVKNHVKLKYAQHLSTYEN